MMTFEPKKASTKNSGEVTPHVHIFVFFFIFTPVKAYKIFVSL